ncbi:tyrosine-type recombinase/integrase [Methanosarcina sp. KYL-1]|uniref:tyrosine-type recombinase/integrase n=1 Tax=Methanosarcina sp. KYL-1 TaxID=2602068 RepID=UPI0021006D69|nr:tyrosine-type recombinase/integrase [Methanosarcina sp. KYL-1]MCQ1535760.1 tyrosine-type recombinase/integrase [Methanosarcina sp. KYL-1]
MKIEEYKKYQVVEDWINTINPSKNTEDRYLLAIKVFCEWTGKNPETLITEAESEILSGILPRQRAIKRDFIGFRRMLQEKGYAPMTVKGYMSGIKSFYRTADIELPNLPRTGKAVPLEEHKEIPTKEDLRDVIKICDPLEKAMLLVGASGGLASNEILNIKVGEFKKGYDPETEITTLSMRRKKVNYDFITFLSPEASRAVWDYINYRGRTVKLDCARREKQIEKQRIFSDSDYLFIGRKIPDTYLQSRDENERKLERDAFMRIYRAISEKAQKNAPKNDWNKVRSHNVRKFFNSTLLNAGADSFFTEFLMGHTLDDTKSAYFRAQPEKLKEIYKKYIPYLTIQKELDISESPEYLKIKQENQILQAETARHVVERSELSELRKELNELKERDKLKSDFIESMKADPEQMFTFMEEVKRFMDKGRKT